MEAPAAVFSEEHFTEDGSLLSSAEYLNLAHTYRGLTLVGLEAKSLPLSLPGPHTLLCNNG